MFRLNDDRASDDRALRQLHDEWFRKQEDVWRRKLDEWLVNGSTARGLNRLLNVNDRLFGGCFCTGADNAMRATSAYESSSLRRRTLKSKSKFVFFFSLTLTVDFLHRTVPWFLVYSFHFLVSAIHFLVPTSPPTRNRKVDSGNLSTFHFSGCWYLSAFYFLVSTFLDYCMRWSSPYRYVRC